MNPNASWSLVSAQYQDETQAGGNHPIYFKVLDASGKPLAGKMSMVDYPQDPSDPHQPFKAQTDANGQSNYPMYANLDITLKNGPYFAYIEDPSKSDVISGMGLPEHRHVNYVLTFKASGGVPPPPPPQASLEQTVIANAQKYAWMPINTDARSTNSRSRITWVILRLTNLNSRLAATPRSVRSTTSRIVYVKKGD